MKIKGCTIYALRIPFVEAFAHSAKSRSYSDSIIVRLISEDGTVGYGEGVARPYVTGETVATAIEHIRRVLWPAVAGHDYQELIPDDDPLKTFAALEESLPESVSDGVIAFHAARCAVELALIDCSLRRQKLSLAEILPPRRPAVTYSGVITSGSKERAMRHARQFKLFGICEVKIKIAQRDEAPRVQAIRETLGAEAKLRIDANGAFNIAQAVAVASELSTFNIDAFEQPIPRTRAHDLAEVRAQSLIPVMADESVVTFADGRALIEAGACDYFNLRLSKCGGIARTLRLAQVARAGGVRVGLGSQVGETAILSAAGRHVAAHLADVAFVEGSYGQLLLKEDVGREPIHFGHGGRAPLLRGDGLGIQVREEVLETSAHGAPLHLGKDG